LHVLPSERRKAGKLFLERGIARAALGRDDAAEDFRTAIGRVVPGYDPAVPVPRSVIDGHAFRELTRRIASDTTPEPVRKQWVTVLAAGRS
jgi:hypothetical protein